jgi:hypothetical protein
MKDNHMDEKFLNHNRLFKECIESLNARILPIEDSKRIADLFEKMCPFRGWNTINMYKFNKKSEEFKEKYPIVMWGKIDWNKIDKKIDASFSPENIVPALKKLFDKPIDMSVYIEWNDASIPVIQANLHEIIKHFDDVISVSLETFIFNPTQGYVIEILPSGQITIGIFPTSDKFSKKETYIDPHILQNNIVFKECIDALNVNLLPSEKEKELDSWFKQNVPITPWGRVDWDKFDKKIDIGYDHKNIKRLLGKLLEAKGPFDKTAYIEWGEIGIPVIQTNLDDIIGHFEDVIPVAFEKFIFNPDLGYVIEVLHSRQITAGIIPTIFKETIA